MEMPKSLLTIYHNPRCSKSREVLGLINDSPTQKEIKGLLKKLNLKAIDIVRKSEPLYIEQFADKKLTQAQLIKILAENPILIERPIVVKGERAVLARPTEKINELL